jgi:hypothetical protein
LGVVRVSMTRQARHSPARFLLCSARPKHPLWSGDGFGASDTVLDRDGRKEALKRVTGAEKISGAPQIFLGCD